MKVLFAPLVVLVCLAMAKGNVVDLAFKLLCTLDKNDPEKVNEIKECDIQMFGEKASWLPAAMQKCENAELPTDNLDELLKEMCKEENEAKMQEMQDCLSAEVAKLHEDQESTLNEWISKCL
ncbi:uncharacterized protein LOC143256873 [Tachypleus tridentatus]|uniref:uncharacterized protein LOC143256873 n=1 Tax=Tachypleus tridentatus TaxID=6853 RepID=UPI003FD3FDB6